MKRNIIRIDESKCDGCGLCVGACVEGAIRIVQGKATLASETYCDGLGACLGKCPRDAITIEEREAPQFDEKSAMAHAQSVKIRHSEQKMHSCPGTRMLKLDHPESHGEGSSPGGSQSELINWPVQLRLISASAPCFQDADLLLVADCVPVAYPDLHRVFLRSRPVVIACPKLDDAEFNVQKLTQILTESSVKSLTVLHMEVPCCKMHLLTAERAIEGCGKALALHEVTITIRGEIHEETRKQTSKGEVR